jgi:hypothetical protein
MHIPAPAGLAFAIQENWDEHVGGKQRRAERNRRSILTTSIYQTPRFSSERYRCG